MLKWPIFALLASTTLAQTDLSPRVAALRADPSTSDSFWESVTREGTPIVERIPNTADCLTTFLVRQTDKTESALVAILNLTQLSDAAYGPQMTMERLPGAPILFRTYRMPCTARFTYKIAENVTVRINGTTPPNEQQSFVDAFHPDPLNRQGQFSSAFGVGSIVELPDAPPQPLVKRNPSIPHGTIETTQLSSKILGNVHPVSVYLPPGYDRIRSSYPFLISFDGESRVDTEDGYFPVPRILDNLIAARRLKPTIGVFIGNAPGARFRELTCGAAFNRFLNEELLPWARDRYHLSADPREALVAGASLGGLTAACVAFDNPKVFGNLVVQSGALMMSERQIRTAETGLPTAPRRGELFTSGFPESGWIISRYAQSPKLPLRIYLEVGQMEDPRWYAPLPFYAMPSTVLAARHFRDVLIAKGYDVTYHEYNDSHEAFSWRGTFGDAVANLFKDPAGSPASSH